MCAGGKVQYVPVEDDYFRAIFARGWCRHDGGCDHEETPAIAAWSSGPSSRSARESGTEAPIELRQPVSRVRRQIRINAAGSEKLARP